MLVRRIWLPQMGQNSGNTSKMRAISIAHILWRLFERAKHKARTVTCSGFILAV